MRIVVDFLLAHPLIAIVLVVLLVSIVATVVKKLFKFALILLVLFVLSGGAVYHFASETAKSLLDGVGRDVKERIEEVIPERLRRSSDDSTNSTGQPAAPTPVRKGKNKRTDQ